MEDPLDNVFMEVIVYEKSVKGKGRLLGIGSTHWVGKIKDIQENLKELMLKYG